MVKTQTITQTVLIKAPPHDVFELIMDEEKHGKLTHSKAVVSRKIGGEFSIYDGELTGKNLELELDKKIVQFWRASDWPKGHFSTIAFNLEKVKNGTRINFVQDGVPDEFVKEISDGWKTYYWDPMKKMLE